MKKIGLVWVLFLGSFSLLSQTPLTEAVQFHVKTVEGETIWLFDLLDQDNKIVVIDFFSTGCGPCQTYAPDYQQAYEAFGSNTGNVFFMGINWGSDNQEVKEFDSIFGLSYPSISGTQGGGNGTYTNYQIQSYPTIIVITPDHQIVEQYVWEPTTDNITTAVINAGGIFVGNPENINKQKSFRLYPNPVQYSATIDLGQQDGNLLEYRIMDRMGHLMETGTLDNGTTDYGKFTLNTSRLKDGLYIVQVSIDDQVLDAIQFEVRK